MQRRLDVHIANSPEGNKFAKIANRGIKIVARLRVFNDRELSRAKPLRCAFCHRVSCLFESVFSCERGHEGNESGAKMAIFPYAAFGGSGPPACRAGIARMASRRVGKNPRSTRRPLGLMSTA
jgi:hypothetical protein